MPFSVDIQFVKRAEVKLGRKLPLSYVAKMCGQNGGVVLTGSDSWSLHPILDDSDTKRLKRTCNDIIRETASARKCPGYPEGALTIGENGVGDKLILLPASADQFAGAVYFWDHETGDLQRIAGDFSELTVERA